MKRESSEVCVLLHVVLQWSMEACSDQPHSYLKPALSPDLSTDLSNHTPHHHPSLKSSLKFHGWPWHQTPAYIIYPYIIYRVKLKCNVHIWLYISDDYYNVYFCVSIMNTVLYVYHRPGLRFSSFIWREVNLKEPLHVCVTEHAQFTAFTSAV